MVSPAASADPDALNPVLDRLKENIRAMGKVVPQGPFQKLHQIRIWIEHDNPETPGAVFHPGADWLREHGYNVDKTGGIEIGNLAHFISWQQIQPWMVFHELSHAWEFRFMDDASKKELDRAFEAAKASGKYESVEYYDSKKVRAYALTNSHEYFAEICEAYFGKNDFYPFDREQLKAFDPAGYALVRHAWGIEKP